MLVLFYLEGENEGIRDLITLFESKVVLESQLVDLPPVLSDLLRTETHRVVIAIHKGREMTRIFKSKRGAKIDRIPVIATVKDDIIKTVYYIEDSIDELEIAKML